MFRKIFITGLVGSLFLQSCLIKDSDTMSDSAMGEAGDVAVFMDKNSWTEFGSVVDSVFMANIPGLPSAEPYFVIRAADETKFEGIYKKNYNLFVIVTGANWPTVKPKMPAKTAARIEELLKGTEIKLLRDTNVWSRPQEVHYLISPTIHQLKTELRNNGEFYLNTALKAEIRSTRSSLIHRKEAYDTFYNNRLNERGYAIRQTHKFRLSVLSDSFIGLSRYLADKFQATYLYAEDYVDQAQFSQEYIVNKRNKIMGRHVEGSDHPGGLRSYMTTDTTVDLARKVFKVGDRYAVETRGWWEMVNDYKGGPFVSYTIHCPELAKVVTVDGVVFAPGREKFRLLRQLELIMSTFETKK